MPSQLYNNSAIEFVCARNFTYDGVDYTCGEDFPNRADNIETLVRARYIIPVVETRHDKPRHWHREIQERELVLRKLGVKYPKRNPKPEEQKVGENRATETHLVETQHHHESHKKPVKKAAARKTTNDDESKED